MADDQIAYLDSYKAKVMRTSFMRTCPVDASWGEPLGIILTVVGSSDNAVGGLFGSDDFLPDEVP